MVRYFFKKCFTVTAKNIIINGILYKIWSEICSLNKIPLCNITIIVIIHFEMQLRMK